MSTALYKDICPESREDHRFLSHYDQSSILKISLIISAWSTRYSLLPGVGVGKGGGGDGCGRAYQEKF